VSAATHRSPAFNLTLTKRVYTPTYAGQHSRCLVMRVAAIPNIRWGSKAIVVLPRWGLWDPRDMALPGKRSNGLASLDLRRRQEYAGKLQFRPKSTISRLIVAPSFSTRAKAS